MGPAEEAASQRLLRAVPAPTETTAAPASGVEARLRLMESVVVNANDAVVVTALDAHGEPRIAYVNAAFTRQTGYEAHEVIDAHPRILVGPATDVASQLELRQAVERRRSATVELAHHRKDGTSFWVENSVTPVLDDTGRCTHIVSIQRDVTDRVEADRALRESEAKLRSLVEHVSDVITILGPDGRFKYTSPSVEWLLGHRLGEWQSAFDLVHPDDRDRIQRTFIDVMAEPGVTGPIELRVLHADGTWRHVEAFVNNLLHDPAIEGMVVTIRDVTDRHTAENLDRSQRAVLEQVVGGAPLATTLTALAQMAEGDEQRDRATIVVVDETGAETRYRERDEPAVAGGAWATWSVPLTIAGADQPVGRLEVASPAPGELSADAWARLERVAHLAVLAVEHHRAAATIARQATRDRLTGLPNRALLQDRVMSAAGRVGRRGGLVAVMAINLDRFTRVNDTLGHAAGDQLLVAIARRLESVLSPQDTLARGGSDEFVVVVEELADASEATALADRLARAVSIPLALGDEEVFCSASIGVALAGHRDDGPETLLERAGAALSRAKAQGGHRVEVYDEESQADLVQRVQTEGALHHALSRGELRLHYQPVIDLTTGTVTGVEALVRWQHPRRGLLAPAEFIALAEENGLIVPIGAWVLEEASRQAMTWRAAGCTPADFTMAVNLSVRQLADPGLGRTVAGALSAAGMPASALCVEVTESVAMADPEGAVRVLQQLKDLGVTLAIDDFGTGHASLAYLHRLPVDVLKVDRSFVSRLPDLGAGEGSLCAAVIRLAHALGLTVVAEGVERPDTLRTLRGLGCERAQGWLFARAEPPEEITKLLESHPAW